MSQKPSQDAKNIGARFRSARSLVLDLNRKSFCERYGINRYTMQSWENGLHVSKGKNVEKFVDALAREGVFCTTEWLIEGIGEPAKPLLGVQKHEVQEQVPKKDLVDRGIDHVIDSLASYSNHFERLVSFLVPDDAMAPKFMAGDRVLGAKLDTDAKRAHEKYCLVELGPGRMIVRKVICTKDNLLLLALDDRLNSFTLSLTTPIYIIVWHFLNQ